MKITREGLGALLRLTSGARIREDPTVHDHDTHPFDRHTGPPHVERFRLIKTDETLKVVCTCAIGTDHDNTIRHPDVAPTLG